MNKILKKISTAIALSSVLITPVFADSIKIVINNNEIETPDAPYIKEERTLVPLRLISENLGINVDWDNKNRQAVLKKDSDDILFADSKRLLFS
ncbi:copper amine oxidase N-terminal domain-containing protein [Peptoniphilus timonensis]|uniref:copper amine oxidase N-terminal domain-containing protein n=1 Tax=Peptoniphilus timonensis TaxID=1268254 RepID=UPI0002DF0D6C|nr:copper amine oxidase N-terminal domain-containing protein [Peptoniphilus timonensis]